MERGDSNWVDVLSVITKQYKKGIHTSTKIIPIEDSFKKNEGFDYKSLLDNRNKAKLNFQANDLVRVADLRRIFSKGDTINWFDKLYKVTETNNDTILSFRIDNLPGRYNEALPKKQD